MSESAIEVENIEFSWRRGAPVLAVRGLSVSGGERVFLQGASGSGKSTLLGLIGGVLTAQSGRVVVLGQSLGDLSARRRDRFRAEHIGFIFQMFNLIPYLSVKANVLLPLAFSRERTVRVAAGNVDGEAVRLLNALGLTDSQLLDRPVTQLSIGQQQRVAAARALLGRPKLIIADEPTSSLDADARADFLQLLMSECAVHNTTLLFVSHDPSLASLFDRTVRMSDINHANTTTRS
jgi:putative ABC transport system ATP-binding protein